MLRLKLGSFRALYRKFLGEGWPELATLAMGWLQANHQTTIWQLFWVIRFGSFSWCKTIDWFGLWYPMIRTPYTESAFLAPQNIIHPVSSNKTFHEPEPPTQTRTLHGATFAKRRALLGRYLATDLSYKTWNSGPKLSKPMQKFRAVIINNHGQCYWQLW